MRASWKEVSDRTPSLVLSVVHTTEQHHLLVKVGRVDSQLKGGFVSCFAQTYRDGAATMPSKHWQRSKLIAGRKPCSEIRDADAS
jgi:hypothetical protein